MPFIGNAGQVSNIFEKNYATTTLRIVEGDTLFQSYNPADSHYKLITTLEEVTRIGASSSNTVNFTNETTGLTTSSNIGVANTNPEHSLDVGTKFWVDLNEANTVWVDGTVFATNYEGDTMELNDSITVRDVLVDKLYPKTNGFIESTSNIGILNTAPTHSLSIGANVQIDEYGSNTFWTSGNVYASRLQVENDLLVGTNQFLVDTTTSNVGIGTLTPMYELEVVGNVYASQNITELSDARFKENVEPIGNALEKVCSISGYTYNKVGDTRRNAGVLAQEVMTVLPEVVHGSEDMNYSVAYGNMVSLLIEAIKELKLEIDELKKSK